MRLSKSVVAVAVAAFVVVAGSRHVEAAPITFNVSATLDSGSVISGTLVLDPTADAVNGGTLTATAPIGQTLNYRQSFGVDAFHYGANFQGPGNNSIDFYLLGQPRDYKGGSILVDIDAFTNSSVVGRSRTNIAPANNIVNYFVSGTTGSGVSLGGTLLIDITTGTVVDQNLTAGSLSFEAAPTVTTNGNSVVLNFFGNGAGLQYIIHNTDTLVGFAGTPGVFSANDPYSTGSLSIGGGFPDVTPGYVSILTTVPEPTSLAAMAVGGAMATRRRR